VAVHTQDATLYECVMNTPRTTGQSYPNKSANHAELRCCRTAVQRYSGDSNLGHCSSGRMARKQSWVNAAARRKPAFRELWNARVRHPGHQSRGDHMVHSIMGSAVVGCVEAVDWISMSSFLTDGSSTQHVDLSGLYNRLAPLDITTLLSRCCAPEHEPSLERDAPTTVCRRWERRPS
jgi:hypothetical protein